MTLNNLILKLLIFFPMDSPGISIHESYQQFHFRKSFHPSQSFQYHPIKRFLKLMPIKFLV